MTAICSTIAASYMPTQEAIYSCPSINLPSPYFLKPPRKYPRFYTIHQIQKVNVNQYI